MKSRRPTLQARNTLLWTLLTYLAGQAMFTIAVEGCRPGWYDPEYRTRLALLRQRTAAEPNRPLLLMVGSSRMVMTFRPEILPTLHATGNVRPLPFNFSHLGSGPAMNLVLLHRLLREGIRPRWLLVEILPACLVRQSYTLPTESAVFADLPVLHRCAPLTKVYSVYVRKRLNPWLRHRGQVLRELALFCGQRKAFPERDPIDLDPLGGDTRWSTLDFLNPNLVDRLKQVARADYGPRMQQFHIQHEIARNYYDILELCRQHGIRAALVLSPESREFRSWYSPTANAELQAFCAHLHEEYNVPIVDARDWLPDDDFVDFHHAPRGGEHFTLRLGRDVLQPFVQGAPPRPGRGAEVAAQNLGAGTVRPGPRFDVRSRPDHLTNNISR